VGRAREERAGPPALCRVKTAAQEAAAALGGKWTGPRWEPSNQRSVRCNAPASRSGFASWPTFAAAPRLAASSHTNESRKKKRGKPNGRVATGNEARSRSHMRELSYQRPLLIIGPGPLEVNGPRPEIKKTQATGGRATRDFGTGLTQLCQATKGQPGRLCTRAAAIGHCAGQVPI